jgi:hypothetical protein
MDPPCPLLALRMRTRLDPGLAALVMRLIGHGSDSEST